MKEKINKGSRFFFFSGLNHALGSFIYRDSCLAPPPEAQGSLPLPGSFPRYFHAIRWPCRNREIGGGDTLGRGRRTRRSSEASSRYKGSPPRRIAVSFWIDRSMSRSKGNLSRTISACTTLHWHHMT